MDQEKRVGLNEAICRQVNEQIKNLADGYDVVRKQAEEAVKVAEETDPRK